MSDFITVLVSDRPARKRITPSGSSPAAQGYHHTGTEVPLACLADLAQVQALVADSTDGFLVRGQLRPGLIQPFRRTHVGPDASLLPCAHRWLLLDFDSFMPEVAPADFATDPAKYALLARAALPPAFHRAAFTWVTTGSAGFKPGVRLRLGFFLDRPVTDTELKAARWPDAVDDSLFTPSQPHYCALPELVGVEDPCSSRAGSFPGEPSVRWEPATATELDTDLAKGVKAVARAEEGRRERVLNGTAYHLGLAHGQAALAPEVFSRLHQTACQHSWPAEEAANKIRCALEAGAAKHAAVRAGWRETLQLTKDGATLPTLHNVLAYVRHHETFVGALGFIVREQKSVWLRPCEWVTEPRPVQDADALELLQWFNHPARGIAFNHKSWTHDALESATRANPVPDELDQYMSSLPSWDGRERVLDLMAQWGVDPSPLTLAQWTAWLIQAYNRAINPGCQADGILVLLGAQGLCKSTGIEALCPHPRFFGRDMPTPGTKEAQQWIGPIWLAELSEMAQSKHDQDVWKSFVSAKEDTYRPPFGRHVITTQRRAVFVGTTNEPRFIRDDTGSRRYWIQVCTRKARPVEIVAMRTQLWAEARARFERGELSYLNESLEQQAARANEAHRDNEADHALAAQLAAEPRYKTSRELRTHDVAGWFALQDLQRYAKPIARALKLLGWTQVVRRIDKKNVRLWIHPEGEHEQDKSQSARPS